MKKLIISAAILAFSFGTAHASSTPKLQALGQVFIPVWTDLQASRRMQNMGYTKWRELQRFAACLIPAENGSQAILIKDGGFLSSTVMVIGGDYDGCTGDVENRYIYGRETPRETAHDNPQMHASDGKCYNVLGVEQVCKGK
jgi:hypothetical protein